MKKLAALLAVVLTCNMFVGFGASAETESETTPVHYSNDLNSMTASQWRDTMPTGFTFVSDASTWYKIIDDEHGMSFGSHGGAKFKYDFGQTIIGKASFSFDILTDKAVLKLNKDTGENVNADWHVQEGDPDQNFGSKSIVGLRGTNLEFNWGSNGKKEIKPNTWHRVDILIDGTENSATYNVYFDGVKCEKPYTVDRAVSTLGFLNGGNDQAWVFIDNIRAELPAGNTQMTASPAKSGKQPAAITDETEIRFSDTLDRSSLETETVTVTETNLSDNSTRELTAGIDIDYTGTKLVVTYPEALNNNCTYSIPIPTDVKGLSGETCSTTAVEFTTYAESELVHYVNDFDNMSATTGISWSSKMPEGFTFVSDASTWYKKIDEEHGVSFGTSGSSQIKYALPEKMGEMSLSFDVMTTGTFSKGWYLMGNRTDTKGEPVIMNIKNDKIYVDWGNTPFDITPNNWYRVDLVMNRTETSTTIDCYANGEKFGTRKLNVKLEYLGIYNDARSGSDTTTWVFMDNMRAESPAGGSKITANVVSKTSDYAQFITSSTIRFSDTIKSASFTDGSAVKVVETNLATNETRELTGATGALDSTKTKLVVTYNEALKGNCKYEIEIPEGLKGLSDEPVGTKTVVGATTVKDLDFYDDFESYSDWQEMSSWTTGSKNTDFDRTGDAYSKGKAVKKENNPMQYTLPAVVSDGKLVVSFDYKKTAGQEKDTGLQVVCDTWTWEQGLRFTEEENEEGKKEGHAYINWESALENAPTVEPGSWNHYDMVFHHDSKLTELYQNGVKVATKDEKYSVKAIKFVSYGTDTSKAGYAVDNFHVRFFGENEVTTNLSGDIASNTTTGRISFKDAVDMSTLTIDNVIVAQGDDYPDISLDNITPYGADIKFTNGLVAGKEYKLYITEVASYSGEPLSKDEFTFNTVDVFDVSSIAIGSGNDTVTSAASWNKDTKYTLTVNVNSTRITETKIQVVIAGYTDKGLVQVETVEVPVTSTGAYTKELAAIDMKGATKIKCFAVDNMSTLAPLMKTPTVIN